MPPPHSRSEGKPPPPPRKLPSTKSSSPPTTDDDNSAATWRSAIDSSPRLLTLAILLVSVLSFATRLHRVAEPPHVCWDETHFGKMANWYLNRTFFFDVHPPLGKMLIALAGHASGYNGTFAFENPGQLYDDYPYVGMRLFCTILGALLAPLAAVSVWNLSSSVMASTAAALFIAFDTGLLTLTQYILLDAPLLFFIMLTAAFCTLGSRLDLESAGSGFGLLWWLCYSLCGASLACAIGVKFVGLFVVLWAGSFTLAKLWAEFGTAPLGLQRAFWQLLARSATLIVVPALVYSGIFAVHLAMLFRSGPGDGFYSSPFQSTLEGNPLANASMPQYVAYGSVVTLKSVHLGSGYLHSHFHLYPEGFGAQQQQITMYGHKDENNRWLVKRAEEKLAVGVYNDSAVPIAYVKHGDRIRLEHLVTTRNLHSHSGVAAPVTRQHQQVTGYGDDGEGDLNDVWVVGVDGGVEGETPISTLISKLRLEHHLTKCTLYAGKQQLPKWGFEQQEVTCNPRSHRMHLDENAWWLVEDNWFGGDRIANVSFQQMRPSFLSRLVESHRVMLQGNSNLKPKADEITSRPWEWPSNLRGQWFSINNESGVKIYLLGNPVIWFGNLLMLASYLAMELWFAVRRKRAYREPLVVRERVIGKYLPACRWLFWGWLLHYAPFFAMGRVLYYHHYFPAHLFACMLSAVALHAAVVSAEAYWSAAAAATSGRVGTGIRAALLTTLRAEHLFHFVWGGVAAALLYGFYQFQVLAYGFEGELTRDADNSTLWRLKWLDSWEF